MNIFLKILKYFVFIVCFMIPITILVCKCFEMPASLILNAMFTYAIWVLSSKLFL